MAKSSPAARAARAARAAARAATAAAKAEEHSEADTEESSEEERLAQEEVEAALREIPDSAEAIVFRRSPAGKWLPLDTIAPDMVTATRFLEDYGGGEYKVIFRGPKKREDGRVVVEIKGTKLLQIDPMIPAKAPPRFREQPAAAGAGAPAMEAAKLQMDLMGQTFAGVMAGIVGALKDLGKPDPMMLEIVKGALARPEPKQKDPYETALELLKLQGAGGNSLKDRLEEIALLREAFGDAGGDRSGSTGWDVAREYLPVISQMVTQDRQDKAIAPARAVPTPAPASNPDAPAAPPATESGPTVVGAEALLSRWLPQLIQKANDNKSPETWARVAVEDMPAGYYRDVLTFLRQPGLLDGIAVRYPAVVPVRTWFEEFLEVMTEELEIQLGERDEDGNPIAGAADAPPAPPSKGSKKGGRK